ncbi:hypothetical protein AMELA_G00026340 [Ameiurus melas]|uniref:Uncharacterized protein n=1 Tax=Ameiurus melas TaxID=219545 RepID=A0A7J6BCS5_AMEME|nr:hypothetical protein AMELA_G00026340 [Ameiurus melas]
MGSRCVQFGVILSHSLILDNRGAEKERKGKRREEKRREGGRVGISGSALLCAPARAVNMDEWPPRALL